MAKKKTLLDKMIENVDEEIAAYETNTKRHLALLVEHRARLVKERDTRAEAKKAKAQP